MQEQRDPWALEEDIEQPPKLEFKPKAHLVLEGSERHDWGVVKDCHGNINAIPDDAEVVGTWSKYGDGTYWVSLQTSLSALEDRATQLYLELADSRIEAMARVGAPTVQKGTRRAPRQPKVAEEPKKDVMFDNLRAKLGTL
jgi:hypothetical protein